MPALHRNCHRAIIRTMAAAAGSLSVIFADFFLNGKNLTLRFIADFDIRRDGRRSGPDGDMLAFFDEIHQFIIGALDGGLKRTDIIVVPG